MKKKITNGNSNVICKCGLGQLKGYCDMMKYPPHSCNIVFKDLGRRVKNIVITISKMNIHSYIQ